MFKKIGMLIAAVIILVSSTSSAFAGYYSFVPNDHDIFDLDHYKYYSWGINWTPNPNEYIVSATLKISNINNWQVEENDNLYIHLLDQANLNLTTFDDNQLGGDNFLGWSSDQILLDTFTDTADYPGPAENYIYNLTPDQLAKLRAYSLDGRFGLGFDADCHYWNDGVKFKIITAPVPEPATMALFATGLLGGIGLRRRKVS